MKTFLRAFAFCAATLIPSGYAAEIKVGDNIDQMAVMMRKLKYQETNLQTVLQLNIGENSWRVGEGELVAEYTHTDKHISNMYYFVSDERSKVIRKTFTFQVISFDPESRRMMISIQK